MKKIFIAILALAVSLSAFAQTPKYVFYFIGDGMGINHVQATNFYNRAMGQPEVNFWNFPVRSFITTYSINSLVTDSAAAGTALATGNKVKNGAISYDAEGNDLVSLAEMAKRSGFAAGVATSVGVNHATPAPYYGSAKSRNNYNELAEQLIASNIDFAAGSTIMTTKKSSMKSADFEKKAREAGINVFIGKEEVKKVKGRVIMLAPGGHFPYAIDRKDGDVRLADFTDAAINHLYSVSPKGFFLMVEGGKIDGAAHSTDAANVVTEINDFCESIDLALAFYAKHPNETLIVVTSDHETGGFVNGAGAYKQSVELLANQKLSKNSLTSKIVKLQKNGADVSWNEVKNLLKTELGLWDKVEVSKEEEKVLTGLYKDAFLDGNSKMEKDLYSSNQLIAAEAVRYLQEKSGVSFSFRSHSGGVVGLYAKGAKASELMNCKDNTDLPKVIAKLARYKQ